MFLTLRQVGYLAKSLQGKVDNIGKQVEILKSDNAEAIAGKAALTIVDNIAQEIILLSLREFFDSSKITLDAEENTPSVKLFTKPTPKGKLHIALDPIDGTLHYIQGKDDYATIVSLIKEGKILTSLMYFPNWDKMYYLHPNGSSYLAENVYKEGIKNSQKLKIPKTKSNLIYVNRRVPREIVNKLKKAGYRVKTTVECRLVAIECLEGKALAFIAHTPQTIDNVMGAIIDKAGGHALNWQGKPLYWPNEKRIPRVLFAQTNPPKFLLSCLT